MFDGGNRRLRKGTQDTLVESPVENTAKQQWLKGGSPMKRLPHSAFFPAGRPNVRKRSSTARTLIEIPEDAKPISDAETIVMSPTSPAADSFSPMRRECANHSPLSTDSSAPAEYQKPKKVVNCFFRLFRDSGGERAERACNAAFLAADAALRLGEASDIPYVKGVASIALLILQRAEAASANNQECSRIITRTSQLCEALEANAERMNGVASEELEEQAKKLQGTFETVSRDIKKLSGRKRCYLLRLVETERDKDIIARCDAALEDALKLFSMESLYAVRIQLKEISHAIADGGKLSQRSLIDMKDLEQEELQRACVPKAAQRAALSSEHSLGSDPPHRSLLPAAPKIFCGRENELIELIAVILKNDSARIAVLGPGGIGKTSLTRKLLHHEAIKERFIINRFFISCDSATSLEGLISLIARCTGLTEERAKANGAPGPSESDVLAHLRMIGSRSDQNLDQAPDAHHPIIIVLDNFESCWEPEHSRANVENFLSILATVENLTLLVTLRGTERPSNVAWTRPFFPPLKPIDPAAAREMFLDVSDAHQYTATHNINSPDEVDELLCLCGYLPLAIRLVAEATASEDGDAAEMLRRWKNTAHSTSLLNNGDGPSYSLEVSIRLSLDSPRMKRVSGASTLLSILALLPDGVRDDPLDKIVPGLQNRDECRLTLLKTALAYKESGRLKVLSPIRSYVTSHENYEIHSRFIGPLQNYFWSFLDFVASGQRDPESIKRVLPELGNIERLIDQALGSEFNRSSAISAAVNLGQLFLSTSLGKPHLTQLQRAFELAEAIGNNKLKADCISTIALAKHRYFSTREDSVGCEGDFQKALELYRAVDDKAGQGRCLHQLGSFYYSVRKFEGAKDSCEKALAFHVEAGCKDGQATTLICLSKIVSAMNEPTLAVDYCEDALRLLCTEHDDPIQRAQCLQFLGFIKSNILCDFPAAQKLLEESSHIYKDLSLEESANCMDTIVSLGEVALICSKYEEAKLAFEKAARTYRKTKKRDREAHARICLGRACLGLRLFEEAAEHIRGGLTIWEEFNHKWGKGISYIALGDLATAQDSLTEAEAHYEDATSCFMSDSKHWKAYEAESRMKMGILTMRMDQVERARECLQRAQQLYDEAACRRGRADCSRYLAELDLKISEGEVQRGALERLEHVQREYDEMGLQVEFHQCDTVIATTLRTLGEKNPKILQVQIGA